MRRLRLASVLGIIGVALLGAAFVAVIAVGAQTPTTGAPTDTPVAPSPTAVSGSPVTGTGAPLGTAGVGSAAASPVEGTAAVPSAPVPPVLTPPVATSSGPSSQQVTIAVIASVIGAAIVALGGFGLIRVIASTSGTPTRR